MQPAKPAVPVTRSSNALLAGLLAALAATFVLLPSALACDPVPPSPLAIVPVNGDRVSPTIEIVVIGEGAMPANGGDFSLSDRAGNPIAVEVKTFGRAGVFEWIAVYRPDEALSPTAYDFNASYNGHGGEPTTVSTSFQVQQVDASTLAKPRVSSWDTVLFSPQVNSMCESFASATRLVIEQAREGDSPLWYEVELTNEDRSETTTRAVVPGAVDTDGRSVTREFHAGFAVGCVGVTPVGFDGVRGETFESCEATLCGTADGEEDDVQTVWESLEECDGSAPGQPSPPGGSTTGRSGADEGCNTGGGATSPTSVWWAVLAVLLIVPCSRRRE